MSSEKQLRLMYKIMQSSLTCNYNQDFDKDCSDVKKVLDWLQDFNKDNEDENKFLQRWGRNYE
jgi:hypothetical protein